MTQQIQSDIINDQLPDGRVETTFANIAEIIMGQSPTGDTCNSQGIGIPLLNGPTEFGEKNPVAVQFTTDAKKLSKKDDILFCVRGSTTGKTNWADKEYAIGRGLAAIKHKSGTIYKHFIKGIIDVKLPDLLSRATGSTFPNVSKDQLENLEVILPPLPEQVAIASLLSSFDDKIELLREENKTLEQTAQTIFQEWFGKYGVDDELPEGWRIGKLGEVIIENRRGISPVYAEKGTPVINQRCIRNHTIIEEAIQFHNDEIKKAPDWAYLCPNDILINSMGVGTLGRVAQAAINIENKYLVHSCITILRANTEVIDPIILGLVIMSLESSIKSMGTGTTGQTSLNNNLLSELKIIIPSKGAQTRISISLSEIKLKIDLNYSQIKSLSQTRDELLPRLMKGEVRVRF